MGDTRATEAYTYSIGEGSTEELKAAFGIVYAVTQIPTAGTLSSEMFTIVLRDGATPSVQVQQISANGVVRGKVDNPKLRSSTFFLDDHEFYHIRLGEDKTFLYDTLTEQWTWWSSKDRTTWRSSLVMNWLSPGAIADDYGSNVVVGDDTHGIIWVLDPTQGWDDSVWSTNTEKQLFKRYAAAQIISRSRTFIPVFDVYLTGSPGAPSYDGAAVTLEYSDDGGQTYVSAGSIPVEVNNFAQNFAWQSLGRIQAPGRLFRILDDGAFARIDGLDVNLGG